MIEVKAQLNHLRMSPKKVRLVANTIKGMPVADALIRLQFIQKAPSPIISKLVRSAMANAKHNNNLTEDLLMVKSIIVEEGVALKRWRPAAFGTAHSFKRRASHIKVILGLKPGAKLPKGVTDKATDAVVTEAVKPVVAQEKKEGAKQETPVAKASTKRTPKSKAKVPKEAKKKS